MRVLIIVALLGTVFTTGVVAQRAAQAVMQVSVRVIKGIKIETKSDNHISITRSNCNDFHIGSIQLTGLGLEDAIVVTPTEITVRTQNGEKIGLRLKTQSGAKDGVDKISFTGSADSHTLKNGTYQGTLVTTIEYL